LELSKHNIVSRITGSDKYYIVNLLSQQADFLTKEEYLKLSKGNFLNDNDFIRKGYCVEPAEEELRYRKKYLEFLNNRETDEVQLFYAPTYACNFACSYCYQDSYFNKCGIPESELVEAFFNFIEERFFNRRKYLTLFGGEPLLNTAVQKAFIENFIWEANKHKLEIAVVTNGYNLSEYIPLLNQGSIREIQVTIDGLDEIHNQRRPMKNGLPTFSKIIEGIDCALKEDIPVNLRMVIDQQNIEELPKLAKFAIEKGWTKNPVFKTQLGRNYDLHHCQSDTSRIYSRLGMYTDIYRLMQLYPEILEFHKPAFSISRFLFENGELPDPLYDSCPGTKNEWAFDSSGKVYSCTATVGKEGEELGMFYPKIELNEDRISEWESRDVLSISECKSCSLQLACGGGCAAVAQNLTGKINSPDCRPVKELIELGMSAYFEKKLYKDNSIDSARSE
jgi:uncharacterized protein